MYPLSKSPLGEMYKCFREESYCRAHKAHEVRASFRNTFALGTFMYKAARMLQQLTETQETRKPMMKQSNISVHVVFVVIIVGSLLLFIIIALIEIRCL